MSCSDRREGNRSGVNRAAAWNALLLALILGALLLPSTAWAQGSKKAKYELKLATLAPEGSTWMNLMNELSQAIREQTQGEVGLRWYPGGIQGDETVVLRKVRSQQLHGGGLTGVGLGQIEPSLRILEAPFLMRSEDELRVVHDKMDAMFEERVHRAGFTVLGWADVGFVYLYSKNPVTTTRELQSQKVWLWEGDPLAEAFLKAAGVSPVPLAITDVLTALQTGLVTTVYITPLANIAMQWFTRISYTTDVPLTFSLGAVVVTNAAFDAIPAQHQQVIRDCCRTYFDQLRVATSADNRESMEVIARHGVKSITPSADDLASFHRIGEQVQEALVGKLYDQALLDQLRTVLIEYRQGSGATGALSPGEAK